MQDPLDIQNVSLVYTQKITQYITTYGYDFAQLAKNLNNLAFCSIAVHQWLRRMV